ncbi:MAG: hypothetical protein ACE5KZ_02640 [Candidatus Scalinduaceae bacterium]
MISDNQKNYMIQWLITEYQEIRKEIERRSKEQFICITGSIISLGSTLAFISKDPSIYSPLLIIIPWILTIFGFIWTDHSHHIFLLGTYIRENIESQINQITTSQNKIGWSHYIQNIRQELKSVNKKPSFIVWLLPLLYFILPSISCIIAYIFMRFGNIAKLPIPIEISLLIIGVIFIICLIISWFRAAKVILK